jgi:hypothetical protein
MGRGACLPSDLILSLSKDEVAGAETAPSAGTVSTQRKD